MRAGTRLRWVDDPLFLAGAEVDIDPPEQRDADQIGRFFHAISGVEIISRR
jgi:hypothetical protein